MRIGIDLGGTKTEGIVMDDAGKIVLRERHPTPREQGYNAIIDNIAQLVRGLEERSGSKCTVGIGTPGAVSGSTGLLKNSNTTCLNNQPVQKDLEVKLNRPVRIENDANCFALSEAVDGAGKGYGVVFGVIMGTGVGAGIVCRGRVHDGPQGIAGEWGHNNLEPDGPDCYCGRRGCVETFISGPGLQQDYERNGGDAELNAQIIAQRAAAGDVLAEAAMQRFLDRFARALSVVINILDPDAIVLGGGLSKLDRLYSEGVERLQPYIFNNELLTPVLPNVHGDSAGVRGAAWLWTPDEAAQQSR